MGKVIIYLNMLLFCGSCFIWTLDINANGSDYEPLNLENITKLAVDFSEYANTPGGGRNEQLDAKLEKLCGDNNIGREAFENEDNVIINIKEMDLYNIDESDYDSLEKELLKTDSLSDAQQEVDSIRGIIDNAKKTLQKKDKKFKQHYGYAIGEFKTGDGENVYVISFRGTHDIKSLAVTDVIQSSTMDFLEYKKGVEPVQVHTGFEFNRQSCMEQKMLSEFVEKIKKDPSNPIIIITGHSLGAGMAVLQAAYFIEEKIVSPEKLYLITFAEPPPGKKDFVKRYSGKFAKGHYYNWSNKNDPVPILPAWNIVGFIHMGEEVKFDSQIEHPVKIKTWGKYMKWRHDLQHYNEEVYNNKRVWK